MASSTPLKDIEEKFFLCSVCLDKFKEPKQLPCLHRYCRDCLKTLIEASDDGTITCPMCKAVYDVPRNGVDDFKTDFHMKSILEFIQLQKSFANKELKKCISCSKKTTVTAYCFKCRHFLCDQCSHSHLNNRMFTDHQPHILNLENIEAQNLTLEKLSTLKEDPRCHVHVKQPAQLCCITCQNVPVCVTCSFGKHKGHDLHDVTEISKSERESLQLILGELKKHKSKLNDLPEKVKATKRKLTENLSKETAKLRIQYEEQVKEIKEKLEENTTEQERQYIHIADQINHIRERMNTLIGTYVKKSDESKKKHNEIEKELNSKLSRLESNMKNITTAQELRAKQNENELKDILDNCKEIIKLHKSFTAITSSMLASNDEWTDAQCIPDIRAVSKPLIEIMKQNFPELESLSDVGAGRAINVIDVGVTTIEQEISVVHVRGINVEGWHIDGITSSRGGIIVITGGISGEYSHITVTNAKGEIQRQDEIKIKTAYPYRYCSFISEFKVAIVGRPGEIGIYDVCDGSYNRKIIPDVTERWPVDRYVWCVANDPVNNHIIVGTNSRDVYVFDDQLNYRHTITLPNTISASRDITLHGGSLLICDNYSKRACAVTMEGPESKLMYEFNKPDCDEENWAPRSVCTDKNGFIYMLWEVRILHRWRRILVQYSQDGRQLLAIKPVGKDCHCVTTLATDEGEKLLISTWSFEKLYIYGLV